MPFDFTTQRKVVGERVPSGGADESLPRTGERHHAGSQRLCQAFDLDWLGAASDVAGSVLAQSHGADMDADPSVEPEIGKCLVVLDRKTGGVRYVVKK